MLFTIGVRGHLALDVFGGLRVIEDGVTTGDLVRSELSGRR